LPNELHSKMHCMVTEALARSKCEYGAQQLDLTSKKGDISISILPIRDCLLLDTRQMINQLETVLTRPLKLYLPHQNQLIITMISRPPTATIAQFMLNTSTGYTVGKTNKIQTKMMNCADDELRCIINYQANTYQKTRKVHCP